MECRKKERNIIMCTCIFGSGSFTIQFRKFLEHMPSIAVHICMNTLRRSSCLYTRGDQKVHGKMFSFVYLSTHSYENIILVTSPKWFLAHLAQSARVSYWGCPLSGVRRRPCVRPCVRPSSTISSNDFFSETTGRKVTKISMYVS